MNPPIDLGGMTQRARAMGGGGSKVTFSGGINIQIPQGTDLSDPAAIAKHPRGMLSQS